VYEMSVRGACGVRVVVNDVAYFIASLPGLPKNAGFSKLNTGSALMYR
jgi:hypothetical protein